MESKRLIGDFAARTNANLDRISDLAASEKSTPPGSRTVFEVPQLINSMLGLLVEKPKNQPQPVWFYPF